MNPSGKTVLTLNSRLRLQGHIFYNVLASRPVIMTSETPHSNAYLITMCFLLVT